MGQEVAGLGQVAGAHLAKIALQRVRTLQPGSAEGLNLRSESTFRAAIALPAGRSGFWHRSGSGFVSSSALLALGIAWDYILLVVLTGGGGAYGL